jgi:ubiquitin fusion degradation protein 1
LQLRKFSCLTKEIPICIQYIGRNYLIDVVDLKPADAVSIIETDCEVDFEAPKDYVEQDWKNQQSQQSVTPITASSPSIVWGSSDSSRQVGSGTLTSPFVLDDDSKDAIVRNTSPLTASGESSSKRARASEAALSRLSGTTPTSTPTAGDPSGGKESKFGLKFTPFQGEGRALSSPAVAAPNRSPLLSASSVGGQVISTGSSAVPKKEKTLNKFEAMKKETSFQGTGRKLA